MPKKLRLNPNQRVDLDDFNRSSYEYSQESASFNREKLVQSFRSLVSHGFRVEIPDQSVVAGAFTVYNGVGIDRNGDLVNNEQQVNDARTATLAGTSSKFYVEVELVEVSSDVDSRAFWDPTDQSFVPPGSEFAFNVATRTTPDWQIITPVSLVRFEVETDANSLRIPIAILETNGSNEIISITKVTAKTVLEEDHAIGATSIRVLDSALFPDTGTIAIGAESGKTLTFNDRANNTLTVDALVAAQVAGAIVENTGGTTTFMPESTEAAPATASGSAVGDVRRRVFAGDEIRGSALSSSKETAGARDDLDVRSQKDHVDLLAAQIRELKFGNLRPNTTSSAPPSTFLSTRYYDAAGGVLGARNFTVSVGDGVSSWGDVNDTDVATAIETAHAALPASGGSIFVKTGDYVWDKAIVFDRPVTLVFDPSAEFVSGTYDASFDSKILFTGGHPYKMVGLPDMDRKMDFYIQLEDTVANNLTLEDCNLSRIRFADACNSIQFEARNCTFRLISRGANASAVRSDNTTLADIDYINFVGCTFAYQSTVASTVTSLVGGHLSKMRFTGCRFDLALDTASCGRYVLSDATTFYVIDVLFDSCVFGETNTGAAIGGITFINAQIEDVTVKDCSFDFTMASGANQSVVGFEPAAGSGFIKSTKVTGCSFQGVCTKGFAGTTEGTQARVVAYLAVDGSCFGNVVSDNLFGRQAGNVPVGFATFVYADGTTAQYIGLSIQGNQFNTFNKAVYLGPWVQGQVTANTFRFHTFGVYNYDLIAVDVSGLGGDSDPCLINDNEISIRNSADATTSDCFGVWGTNTGKPLVVSGNSFFLNGGDTVDSSAVSVANSTGSRTLTAAVVGNHINMFTNGTNADGIALSQGAANTDNNFIVASNTINIQHDGTAYARGVWCNNAGNNNTDATGSSIAGNTISLTSTSANPSQMTGIVGLNLRRFDISDNVVVVAPDSTTAGAGISVDGKRSSVSGNKITTTANCSGGSLSVVPDGSGFSVIGNTITCGSGIALRLITVTDSVVNLVVSGNSIEQVSNNNGDHILEVQVFSNGVRGLAIVGNTLTEVFPNANQLNREAIRVECSATTTDLKGVNISSNLINGNPSAIVGYHRFANAAAIHITSVAYATLGGNIISGWGDTNVQALAVVVTNCDNVLINGNNFEGSSGAIDISSSGSDYVFVDGNLLGADATVFLGGTNLEDNIPNATGNLQ